ncbi:MAG: site-specific integrase [Candidatus Pacearchaeota archaeon]|jgi:integrase
MTEERLDIHHSKRIFEYYQNKVEESSMSEKQKAGIVKFVREAQLGKNSKKKVGIRRLASNLGSFLRLHQYFKKDFNMLTEADIERFAQDLDNDRIKQQSGKPYKKSSKDELIRNLKRYLKTIWSTEDYNKKARWLKEYDEVPEIPAIPYKDWSKFVKGFKFLRDEALTMFLLDSGCRIEEALNIKIKDIQKIKKEKSEDEFYMITIDGTKTKLAKRRIGIPIATPMISEWLKEHPAILDKEAYLFPCTYDGYRKLLRETSKKVLGYAATPHQLRHSSCSHYAKIMKAYPFAVRYGWSFRSDMIARYIDRTELENDAEQLDNVIKNSKVAELEEQMKSMQVKHDEAMKELDAVLKNLALMKDKNMVELPEEYRGKQLYVKKITRVVRKE